MNQILTQIQEEFDKDCPWLGSTYEQDAKNRKWVSDFLTQSNQRVLEKVKEILKKHRGIYGMGNIDDVYLELSTLIEQK